MPLSIPIPRFGLGAAPLGSTHENDTFGTVTEAAAIATVQRCLERGINFFDTAPLYGSGESERRLGLALQGVPRQQYVIASKVGYLPDGKGGVNTSYTRDGVLRSIEGSLQRLKIDFIDVVHIHESDNFADEALAVAFPTLMELKEQGVIGAIGSGVNQWSVLERFARSAPFDCFLLAGRYTLLEQGPLHVFFPLCLEKGIGIFLGGVFNTGILAIGTKPGVTYQYGKPPADIWAKAQRIEAVCDRHGVALKAAALQFAAAHPVVRSLVVGMKSAVEVDENVAALNALLPAAFWVELKELELISLPDTELTAHVTQLENLT